MSAIYWALCGIDLLGHREDLDNEKILEFVLSCQQENGGFSGNVNHDAHMLYTLSAVQILAIIRKLDKIDKDKVAKCTINF
jgi:geranylgeranyl transferase type-2 subunit beta